MSDYSKIQCKREDHTYPIILGTEQISTTLCLVSMGADKVGLTYESTFSGVEDGHVSGGPVEIDGDESRTLHRDPKVELIVSKYHNDGSYASMHVEITVDIPIVGQRTIYRQTLGGRYSASETGWGRTLRSVGREAVRRARVADVASGPGSHVDVWYDGTSWYTVDPANSSNASPITEYTFELSTNFVSGTEVSLHVRNADANSSHEFQTALYAAPGSCSWVSYQDQVVKLQKREGSNVDARRWTFRDCMEGDYFAIIPNEGGDPTFRIRFTGGGGN